MVNFKIIIILMIIFVTLSCTTESTRTVCSKQDTNILVSCDNYKCEVSDYQFTSTAIGSIARCKWEKE